MLLKIILFISDENFENLHLFENIFLNKNIKIKKKIIMILVIIARYKY